MSSASRSIRRRLALALAAVPGHLARLGRPRRLLPLAQRRQQRPVHEQVGVAPDRRGEVAVGRAAEAGMTAVAVAVGGLLQGTEHERCIRLPAVPAPRRLARPRAGSPPPPPHRPGAGARPWPQRRGRHAERRAAARPGARPAPDRAGRARGRPPARACARAAARPARWRGSSAARSSGATRSAATERAATTSPAGVEANSGSLDSTSRLVAPRCSPSDAAASRADRQRLGHDLGRTASRPAKTRSSWS